jgi:uncharacterized protein involved in type VI secretion and phage assembly
MSGQRRPYPTHFVTPERRVQKDQIISRRIGFQPGMGLNLPDSHAVGPQALGIGPQGHAGQPILLDQDDLCGAPGSRLETQGTAARKQIQAMPSRQGLAQPIEQGFPAPGRGGTQSGAVVKRQPPAPPLPPDNPNFSFHLE